MQDFDGLPMVGGHSALDFINTVEFRGAPQPGDRLNSFEELARWSTAAGLLSQEELARVIAPRSVRAPPAARVWRSAIELREALHAVVAAHIRNAPFPRVCARHRRAALAKRGGRIDFAICREWLALLLAYPHPQSRRHRPSACRFGKQPVAVARYHGGASVRRPRIAIGFSSIAATAIAAYGASRRNAETWSGCAARAPAQPLRLESTSQIEHDFARRMSALVSVSCSGEPREARHFGYGGSYGAGDHAICNAS